MSKLEQLQLLLQESPTDSFLLHAIALENIKLGNYEYAKQLFEKLLQLNENYVGSYYHLGKTLEQLQNVNTAIGTYKKGMQIAKQLGDKHAYNELQMALQEIEDDDDD